MIRALLEQLLENIWIIGVWELLVRPAWWPREESCPPAPRQGEKHPGGPPTSSTTAG